MEKVLNMTYESSITKLTEVNSSFDAGVLRICYTGDNRNGSSISKDAIKRSLPTIYNCPIVCNYDRESDTLGGHDMEVVRDKDGRLEIVNMTQPVGVIPESAEVWFEEYEEKDGTKKEYLYAEALIWKRQEAYKKIKDDGITAHSMEINVKDGETREDGFFEIKNFEFTAFALIGVEPCFESSSLTMFSKQEFKDEFTKMMQDLKEASASYNLQSAAQVVDDIEKTNNNPTKGGTTSLDTAMKNKVVEEAAVEPDETTKEFDVAKETAPKKDDDPQVGGAGAATSKEDDDANVDDEPGTNDEGDDKEKEEFALNSELVDEIRNEIKSVKVVREWGTETRYRYVDFDAELKEVYAWDSTDWLLYGFKYELDNDTVKIDFDTKSRKKYAIVDFVEGDTQGSPFIDVVNSYSELEQKYNESVSKISEMESELSELKEFKCNTEMAERESAVKDVFSKFEDLSGIEAFDTLKENCGDMEVADIEEKCFAIRGRSGVVAKAAQEKAPKLKVCVTEKSSGTSKYGSLFDRYLGDK